MGGRQGGKINEKPKTVSGLCEGGKVGEALRILWACGREEVEATAVGLLQSLGQD